MGVLRKYMVHVKVNKSRNLSELAHAIIYAADKDGMIQGRERKFNAIKMAAACENYLDYPPNVLTREFGIRQQALYLTKR